MVKHKSAKKKVYLNDVDVPVSKTSAKVVKSNNGTQGVSSHRTEPPKSILKSSSASSQPAPEQQPSTSAPGKYGLPELFSTLAVSKRVEKVRNTKAAPITSAGQLTPNSKKELNTKITKKLNHQPETNVYSGLAPIGVTDGQRLPAEPRAKYQFTGKRDPEPELRDYLIPLEPYVVKLDFHTQVHTVEKKWNNNYINIAYVTAVISGEYSPQHT